NAMVGIGDARSMRDIRDASVDAVLTSPPYLNALDYIRGHRLSLVWLGYTASQLRTVRANSIGAERAPEKGGLSVPEQIGQAFGDIDHLPNRHRRMINRY